MLYASTLSAEESNKLYFLTLDKPYTSHQGYKWNSSSQLIFNEIDLDNVIIKQCLGKNIKDSEIVEGVVIRHELADPNGLKYLKNTK